MKKREYEHIDPYIGLTQEQVLSMKMNIVPDTTQKSIKTIIRQQTLTLFNGINVFLACLVILTGAYENMLFMGIVVTNVCIGIVQEIRAKKQLDKLALLNQPVSKVVRDGQVHTIQDAEIVENDILLLNAGDQLSCDCVVVLGHAEVNESMLTGESDLVDKQQGDSLWSGSYLESGQVRAQVLTVGEDTYAYSILRHVKRKKRFPSQLRDSVNLIIRFSTIILIPAGILLFAKEMGLTGQWKDAILSMVAAVVGMIPEGLVFLTSVALTIGSIKLGKQKVLVQELYCIETLARVDTLCLDKTGTITQGKMEVVDCVLQSDLSLSEIQSILSRMYTILEDDNATAKAIRTYVGSTNIEPYLSIIPFSSARKACAISFSEEENYAVGAYQFLVDTPDPELLEKIETYAKQGMRVLTLVRSHTLWKESLKGDHEVLAFILLRDVLREHIQEILSYFYKQGVDIKIISGDDAQTVAAIAKSAGVHGKLKNMSEQVDIEDAVKNYSIFGRVSPEQKKEMVLALKKQGHTVAMTGDGVNDVMALKEADCSIAMGSGSEATKNVASLVLLENQFSSLPSILYEGRRVVNNIQRSASLFLVKTLFSLGLTLLTLGFLQGYPFVPIQLTLISSLATGIPSFVLTLEPNTKRVQGHFLKTVFARAIPGAFCVVGSVCMISYFQDFLQINDAQFSTMCTYLAGWNALCVLMSVCTPMTRLRFILVSVMSLIFVGCILWMPNLFDLVSLSIHQWIFVLGNAVCIPIVISVFTWLINRYILHEEFN